MALTLYHKAGDVRAVKLRIAAKYVGLELSVKSSEDELLAMAEKCTLGKLPLLETPQGVLFASNAILRHLARVGKGHGLYGANNYEMSVIDAWIEWATDVELPAAAWLYQVWGLTDAADVETRNMAARDVRDALAALNRALVDKTFLVGEQATLADIAVATVLVDLYKTVLDARFRHKFANVTRWFETFVNQPLVAEVLGPVALCDSTPGAPLPADILGDDEHASLAAEAAKDVAQVDAPKSDVAVPVVAEPPASASDAEGALSPRRASGALSPRPSSGSLSGEGTPKPLPSVPSAEHRRVASSSASASEDASHSESAAEGKAFSRGSLSARPPSTNTLPTPGASEGEAGDVQHGVSLKPVPGALRVEFELKAGGPDGQGGVLGIFNKKSKEIWITLHDIKGKLSDDHLLGLQSLLKAEKATMHKKKTAAYLLFQDQTAADTLLSQKTLAVYIQQ